jgi:hypothetical protein
MKFNYSWGKTRLDLLAGVTVAAISLPQAMAYALIAGVDPRFGLYSAIVVTLVASIFGSSSHLINGPTNAISLVVFSALGFFSPDARLDAYQAMFLLGIMIGSIQILIAIFKLGDLTRYISAGQSDGLARSWNRAAACAVPHLAHAECRPCESKGSWHRSGNNCSCRSAEKISAQISSATI